MSARNALVLAAVALVSCGHSGPSAPAPGTVSGTVIVGELAAGHDVGLSVDGKPLVLQRNAPVGEIPFTVKDLATGIHSVFAWSDRNDDGVFLPLLDLTSEIATVQLDLNDPLKDSANVTLYLAASLPGLCTIRGTVTFTKPVEGLNLMVAAPSPDTLSSVTDIAGLGGNLGGAYQVLTNATETSYPYVLTNLQPGTYLPLAAVLGAGGGVAVNVVVNPMAVKMLKAGDVAQADFAYGSVAISGTATLTPAQPPSRPVMGVVAARNMSLTQLSIQAVLMPTLFAPAGAELKGSFAAQALRDGQTFDLKAFTNEGGDPFSSALAWLMDPLGGDKDASVKAEPGAKADFSVPAR